MYDFDGSATIATSPDRLFNYVADVRHLPEYLPKALSAKAGDGEDLTVVLDVDGDPLEITAWYRVDRERRVVQWGVPDHGYQGWVAVVAVPDGCELTMNVQAPDRYDDAGDMDGTEAELRDTVRSIARIMGRSQAEQAAG
jgi:hypothetical protein